MIYRFIDTADRTPRADLPAEALNINGKYLEDIVPGYRTLAVAGREAMSAEVNTLETGRADGVNYNFKRYPERVITITYQLLADTPEKFRKAFNTLGGALNCEQVRLIFNDELDKFFTGTPGELGEIEPGKNKVTGEFQIICTDPFKYSITEFYTDVDLDTPKKIRYGGTVPTFPRMVGNNSSGNVWFESYSIDDNLLVLSEPNESGYTQEEAGSMSSPAETTESGWTVRTKTITGAYEEYQITGKLRYKPTDATNIFRFDIYGATNTDSYAPRIRFYRNYVDGCPITEIQFLIGSEIVYRQTIDDDSGDNRIPFRLSFSHSQNIVSIMAGQMTGTYYFQVRDIVYETRKSWPWTASDATGTLPFAITGAKYAAASYYMDDFPTNWDNTIMHLYNGPLDKCGSVFPYNDATLIRPETGEILVSELNTPRFGNPANRWENFKLKPGENTLNCNAFGVGRSSFTARFYWREKFI